MTNTPHTVSANDQPVPRRTPAAAGGSQWWKAWLLLTSVGVTTLGWLAFPQAGQPAATGVASTLPPAPAVQARALRVQAPDGVVRRQAIVPALRALPKRPVFRTPVTRTRRS